VPLAFEIWPTERLVEYARNPRDNDAQVDRMVGAIREFGFRIPIVAKSDGLVVDGHLRLKAARKLGLVEVPVVLADELTDAQIKAFRLLANKSAGWASWDDDLLRLELADLQADGFSLELTGFSGDELADLMADRTAGLTDPDDAPPAPVNPVTAPGDVWLLGRHRLCCGDSTDAGTVARALNGAKPHLMVTDPPYGVNYDPAWRQRGGLNGPEAAAGKVMNDDRADWREAWALFPGAVAYVWHGGLHAGPVADSLAAHRFRVRAQIVWVKTRQVIGRGAYHWQHEPCLYAVAEGAGDDGWQDRFEAGHEVAAYAVRDGQTARWRGGRKQSTVWFMEHVKSETGHGTQKPVEAMRRPIENNSVPGQAVYDPFVGSGTLIIACEQTGRVAIALELNPAYVDVSAQRWMNFVGAEAVLEATGQTFAEVCEQRFAADAGRNSAASYDAAVAAARAALEAAE
jgi:DNA modification methylase